jgi:hypothetical protein
MVRLFEIKGRRERPPHRPPVTCPVLEVWRMAVAVKTGELRVTESERKLIYCLRDVRNSLAHLVALDDSMLSRLAQVIANSPVRSR